MLAGAVQSATESSGRLASLTKIPKLDVVVLCGLLLVQNVMEAHLMHLSRSVPGEKYLVTSAALLMQVAKVIFCLIILFAQGTVPSEIISHFRSLALRDWFILYLPSLMYTTQNNLRFYALHNLSSSTYQVLSQLKILTTALFSILVLGRVIHRIQWVSLVLLMCGMLLVKITGQDDPNHPERSQLVGTVAVLVIALLSGAAGVYMEKISKRDMSVSIFFINIQLALMSIIDNVLLLTATHGPLVFVDGRFLAGYTPLVWVVVLLGAFGGIFVALVVRYSSSLAKTYVTSSAIFLNTVIDSLGGKTEISAQFWIAVVVVACAVLLFNDSSMHQK